MTTQTNADLTSTEPRLRIRARPSACGLARKLLETTEMTDQEIFDQMTAKFPGKTYTVALVKRYRRELIAIERYRRELMGGSNN